jgi:gamma-glutamyltranspeptidase
MGGVQAIARDANGDWIGAADPRREGTADGA